MNFFRRGRAAQEEDAEGQTVEMGPPNMHSQVGNREPSSWGLRRPAFLGRRQQTDAVDVEAPPSPPPPPSPPRHDDMAPGESPKTSRFNFTALPSLQFPWSRAENGAERASTDAQHMDAAGGHGGQQMPEEMDTRPLPAIPQPSASGEADSEPRPRAFSGPDPAELRLAQMADDGRQRRQRRGHRGLRLGRLEYVQPGSRPKNFMFCFPWIESRQLRLLILHSFVSGIFTTLMLAIYLALALSHSLATSEFSILLILIILVSAAFFCHTVIRIFLLIYRPPRPETEQPGVQRIGGYAVPEEPIRVVLARDEEEVEQSESDAAPKKPKPPPYGAWRQSIRVDPNRIYWQRNPEAPESDTQENGNRRSGTAAGPRPPSYISEDGVDYVVEARPRSMAPTAFGAQVEEVPTPLPVHPSEAGRWNGQQAPWQG